MPTPQILQALVLKPFIGDRDYRYIAQKSASLSTKYYARHRDGATAPTFWHWEPQHTHHQSPPIRYDLTAMDGGNAGNAGAHQWIRATRVAALTSAGCCSNHPHMMNPFTFTLSTFYTSIHIGRSRTYPWASRHSYILYNVLHGTRTSLYIVAPIKR